MIKIVCSGKIKEDYLEKMISDYKKRISKYHKIEIVEIKDENDLILEKQQIEKNINNKDYVIALTIDGKKLDSLNFAKMIDNVFITNSTIVFVIGSSIGLHDDVIKRANLKLSFSDMTFPHGLFRAILLEQIYRAFKIINNETYHK